MEVVLDLITPATHIVDIFVSNPWGFVTVTPPAPVDLSLVVYGWVARRCFVPWAACFVSIVVLVLGISYVCVVGIYIPNRYRFVLVGTLRHLLPQNTRLLLFFVVFGCPRVGMRC